MSNTPVSAQIRNDITFISFYLDWVNNWLTTDAMAEHYALSLYECERRIKLGRDRHHAKIQREKALQ